MVVNVASECGLAETNYRQLSELHTRYESEGLRIVAFPCNQFLGQEPGTSLFSWKIQLIHLILIGDDATIRQYVKSKNVQFAVFDKIDVNG